jgi:hypothetical protein
MKPSTEGGRDSGTAGAGSYGDGNDHSFSCFHSKFKRRGTEVTPRQFQFKAGNTTSGVAIERENKSSKTIGSCILGDEMKEIKQIMPAPGWRVICACINDNVVNFDDTPVIGWGLVHHSEDNQEEYTEVELLVFHGGYERVTTLDEAEEDCRGSNATYFQLAPNENADEYKQEWAESLRNLMAYRKEAQQKTKA